MFIMIKVVQYDQQHFEAISFFTFCAIFDVWRHIAVILPFFSNLLTYSLFLCNPNLISKGCFYSKRCSAWSKKHFEKFLSHTMSRFWRMTSSIAVILQFSSNFCLNLLFRQFGCKITEKRQNDSCITLYIENGTQYVKENFFKIYLWSYWLTLSAINIT